MVTDPPLDIAGTSRDAAGGAGAWRRYARAVPGSRVALPPSVRAPFTVYLNGVPQQEGTDYVLRDGALHFPGELRKDRVSGRRWLLGAFGVGTYRQDDSVDVRYERDGRTALAEGLEIES